MSEQVLMTYFVKYLKEIRKVSDSSVKHYQDALKYISKYLVEQKKLQQTIYEIQNIEELEVIKTYLYSNPYFMELNKRGHQMYSVSFNHYYKFASGKGFANLYRQIAVMDIEVPVIPKQTRSIENWKRSAIIKVQAIESAGYQCEANPEHSTFIAKSTGRAYMEGHHVLPMKYQGDFSKSLDVYANIVCLCPVCHRLLHYGVATEMESILNKIYYDRSDRLAASGIKISKPDFEKLII